MVLTTEVNEYGTELHRGEGSQGKIRVEIGFADYNQAFIISKMFHKTQFHPETLNFDLFHVSQFQVETLPNFGIWQEKDGLPRQKLQTPCSA